MDEEKTINVSYSKLFLKTIWNTFKQIFKYLFTNVLIFAFLFLIGFSVYKGWISEYFLLLFLLIFVYKFFLIVKFIFTLILRNFKISKIGNSTYEIKLKSIEDIKENSQ